MTTTATTSTTKIPSSLSAACDNVEHPNETRMGRIENVEAYILANAPLKLKPKTNTAGEQEGDTAIVAAADESTSTSQKSSSVAAEQEKNYFMLAYRDGEGRTALHWAIALKNFDLARALLQIAAKLQFPTAEQQQEQQQQQNEDAASSSTPNSGSSWSLPPDTNSTTVLASACAVSAPIDLISDLIFQATGISNNNNNNNTQQTSSKAVQQQQQQQQHPFISTPDAQGNTALHLAASRGNIKLVSFLINSYNADPREKNKRGQTTLHRIVARGDTSAVEELLIIMRKRYPTEVKKFVNSVDKNGDTALHYASMEENREIGEFLLRNGGDRNIKNKDGKEFWQL